MEGVLGQPGGLCSSEMLLGSHVRVPTPVRQRFRIPSCAIKDQSTVFQSRELCGTETVCPLDHGQP